ncbi:MAG: hypothetical protein CML17_07260 [Pusillimonas sp.]|nr:hypothetical protein [Pusillimonas sp.]
MSRKSIQEQIAAARAALQRAQARQRQQDTRAKIVLGGYLIEWVRADHQAARMLLSWLNSEHPREQDLEALTDFLDELAQLVRSVNSAGPHGNAQS